MSSNNSTDNNKRKKWKAPALIGGGLLVSSLILSIVLIEIGTWKADWIGISADQEKTTIQEHSPPTVDGAVTKYTVTTKDVPAKTLWDWLSVLGVPFSLALLGFWFQSLSAKQAEIEKERANEQAALEKEIAESHQKEEILQAYFDRLASLLVDKNLIAIAAKVEESSDATKEELLSTSKDIIRARTLSILRRLGEDGKRKFSVMQFLIEAGVISKLKLDLSGANLRSANLDRVELNGANLSRANLNGANLRSTNLSGANLRIANFSGANLSGANLSRANLDRVELDGADLSGADLSDARNLTLEQVAQAKLCQTKLPPDIQIDLNRDCKELGIKLSVII